MLRYEAFKRSYPLIAACDGEDDTGRTLQEAAAGSVR